MYLLQIHMSVNNMQKTLNITNITINVRNIWWLDLQINYKSIRRPQHWLQL